MAQWIELQPVNRKVTGLIPGQGTCLVCSPGPHVGVCERQLIDVSLPVFLPPFLSLKINKIKILKKLLLKQVKIYNVRVIIYFYLTLDFLTLTIVLELEIGNKFTHIMALLCHLIFIQFFTEVLVHSNICYLIERDCVVCNMSMTCVSTKFLNIKVIGF